MPKASMIVSDQDGTGRELNRRALTPADVALIREVAIKGELATFDERRFSAEERHEFLNRPEVRAELARLATLIKNGDAIMARQTFVARLGLGDMLDEATLIIRRALRGTLPDASGKRLSQSELPDEHQVSVAFQLLNMCGVNQQGFKTLVSTNLLGTDIDDGVPSIHDAEHHTDEILKRERARTALGSVLATLAAAEDQIMDLKEQRRVGKERKLNRKKRRDRD